MERPAIGAKDKRNKTKEIDAQTTLNRPHPPGLFDIPRGFYLVPSGFPLLESSVSFHTSCICAQRSQRDCTST